jgi:hypothetical protein
MRETVKRLNFDVPEARYIELKQLTDDLDVDMKTLFNNALTIFEWCVRETKAGNEIAAVNEAKQVYRVLVTPLLLKQYQSTGQDFVHPTVNA